MLKRYIITKTNKETNHQYCVKNNIYGQCKKMAELIRKGKYTNTTIDPHFKKGLEEFGIFMKTEPTNYSHEKIILIIISEKKP